MRIDDPTYIRSVNQTHPTTNPILIPPFKSKPGRSTEMILGKIFGGQGGNTKTAPVPTATGTKQGGRLNLKAIPKDAPKTKPAASTKAAAPAFPSFSFGGAKKKAAAPQEVTARMINGKLVRTT